LNRYVIGVQALLFAVGASGTTAWSACPQQTTAPHQTTVKANKALPRPFAAATLGHVHVAPHWQQGRLDYIAFVWTDQRAGDCHMSGELDLFPDGRSRWSANSMTQHTHHYDVWHEDLAVYDSSGGLLFGFGRYDSPHMYNEWAWYWWADDGNFPRELYSRVNYATSAGSC
jgi:Family of unknown function (DUF6294)